MRMSSEQLAVLLAAMENKPDAWFKAQLGALEEPDGPDHGGPRGGDRDWDIDVDPVIPLPGGVEVPLPLVVPADIEERFVGWTRKLCHTGPESEQLQIYFDNGTTRSGFQQSWLTCLIHPEGCIRWRKAFGTQRRFCSYMYAWHTCGRRPEVTSRSLHMGLEPSETFVDAIERDLIMADF